MEKYTQPISTHSTLGPRYFKKPLSRRLALVTKTDMPIKQHFYQPLLALISFPAVTFTALTYSMLLAWFSIIASASAYFLLDAPYNFSPANIGLFHLARFIRATLGALVGGPLSDWSAVYLARRNRGIFEPEIRL